jgi:hypothetical protein
MSKEKQRSNVMTASGVAALIGIAVVVRGISLAWRPGGWIAAGLFITLPAVFVAYDAFRGK